MESKKEELIRRLYKKLHDNILRKEKKLRDGSVLWSLMMMIEKKRKELMDESTIGRYAFPSIGILEIEDDPRLSLGEDADGVGFFQLTSMGIWDYEKREKEMSEKSLIDLIQGKFFSFSKTKKPLDDKDRLAIVSMVATRSFNLDTAMDLNTSEYLEGWQVVFEKCFALVEEVNGFKRAYGSIEKLMESSGASHPVMRLMRHRNELSLKTGNVFQNPGKYRYWLNIVENGKFQDKRLEKLLRLVFVDNLDFAAYYRLKDRLEAITHENAKYVRASFDFINPQYDGHVNDVVRRLAF